jgi:hypothetical protein
MAKSNQNTQAKRRRELAKKDKRAAKDEKRALRKHEARVARSVATGEPLPAAPRSERRTSSSPLAPPKLNASSLAAAAFIKRMKKSATP